MSCSRCKLKKINTLAIILADFLVVDKSISAPGNEPRPKHGVIEGEFIMLPLPLCSSITSAADMTRVFFSSSKRYGVVVQWRHNIIPAYDEIGFSLFLYWLKLRAPTVWSCSNSLLIWIKQVY